MGRVFRAIIIGLFVTVGLLECAITWGLVPVVWELLEFGLLILGLLLGLIALVVMGLARLFKKR